MQLEAHVEDRLEMTLEGNWGPVQRVLKDGLKSVDFPRGSGEPWTLLDKEVT
jgi:hypothetical protein